MAYQKKDSSQRIPMQKKKIIQQKHKIDYIGNLEFFEAIRITCNIFFQRNLLIDLHQFTLFQFLFVFIH